ncbi:PAQR family membrane homeostasis protein TrhA [Amphibacillus sediminis]|uniref:PAQR family membrane homeostasis protein TrhA n=1 Tax=Amphibacillus sediminis TaxID=360185 RepID=UPI0008354BE0|nr:hemolysin III family protein [Amphibacillus sediminis]
MNRYIREPINGLTHLVGAILSFIALLAMTIKASMNIGTISAILSVIIFGISMILLYSASATYHMVVARDHIIAWLRKLDHAMIFMLIAGTYTPFCLITLNGPVGWSLLAIIWLTAISGILFKLIWFTCPRWLSTVLYIVMGWIIVVVAAPLLANMAKMGVFLLLAGGIVYTVGGIIYAIKPRWLNLKHMGFHEIFHLFILAGSLLHFISIYYYVL